MPSRHDLLSDDPAQIDEPTMLFRITRTFPTVKSEQDLYQTTRGIWVVPGPRKENARYAMAVYKGTVKEVYRIDTWCPATTEYENRPDITAERTKGRWEFHGERADEAVRGKYLNKSVKHHFIGLDRNPVAYVNC